MNLVYARARLGAKAMGGKSIEEADEPDEASCRREQGLERRGAIPELLRQFRVDGGHMQDLERSGGFVIRDADDDPLVGDPEAVSDHLAPARPRAGRRHREYRRRADRVELA